MTKTVLLRHKSGWLIVHDSSGFPSSNYSVFKATSWNQTQRLPSHGVSYCSSLENALCTIFQQLIVENVARAREYRGTLQDLKAVIDAARDDLRFLLNPRR